MGNNKHPVPGERWIYRQSLREYLVKEVKDGEVTYVTSQPYYPASDKFFKKTLTEFLERFVRPENVTGEVIDEATQEQIKLLKEQGIL